MIRLPLKNRMRLTIYLNIPFICLLFRCATPALMVDDYLRDPVQHPMFHQDTVIDDNIIKSGSKIESFYMAETDSGDAFVIELSKNTKYRYNSLTNPDRVYIDLLNTYIEPVHQSIDIPDKVVQRIRIGSPTAGTARIVLDCTSKISVRDAAFPDKKQVWLILGSSSASPDLPTKSDGVVYINKTDNNTIPDELGIKFNTIILDPGHGGKDSGAMSRNGIKEKDITLDIALRLKKIINDDGQFKVYLTREKDVFVPLEERTAFANQKQGDLFISIHANSHESPDKTGIETYYLSATEDADSRAVAAMENRTAKSTYHEFNELIEKIIKSSKIQESEQFANTVQQQLIHRTNEVDRGVKKARFVVLAGASMPSILTEVAFLSNPRGEELLKSKFYRHMVAEALFQSIKAYAGTPIAETGD
ncbi:N-acetylmuramoyl-L-alanine amidase [candidate division KSB1 bacterium]|nr:N-acetylmuramoyl-L-alanine amidase [candidate division KSB1 bacterium]